MAHLCRRSPISISTLLVCFKKIPVMFSVTANFAVTFMFLERRQLFLSSETLTDLRSLLPTVSVASPSFDYILEHCVIFGGSPTIDPDPGPPSPTTFITRNLTIDCGASVFIHCRLYHNIYTKLFLWYN